MIDADADAAERAAMQTYIDKYLMFRSLCHNDPPVMVADTDIETLFRGYITGGKTI